jgi:hypothetical protein
MPALFSPLLDEQEVNEYKEITREMTVAYTGLIDKNSFTKTKAKIRKYIEAKR